MYKNKRIALCAKSIASVTVLTLLVSISAFGDNQPPVDTSNTKEHYSPYAGRDYPTRVYFGDTHHHTANSGDAFMGGNRLSPD